MEERERGCLMNLVSMEARKARVKEEEKTREDKKSRKTKW
jgi:hypothetical protein